MRVWCSSFGTVLILYHIQTVEKMNQLVIFFSIIIVLLLIIFNRSRKTQVLQKPKPTTSRKIYFAGPLFNVQELIGNEVLTAAIEKHSEGRYQVILPQRLEQSKGRSDEIRNNDLLNVMNSDGIILNLTGAEVDAGAVVEFMVSKFMAKPALILKADVRAFSVGSEYNLMLSNYPMTELLILDSLQIYKAAGDNTETLVTTLADKIIEYLDKAFELPVLQPVERDHALNLLGITTGF